MDVSISQCLRVYTRNARVPLHLVPERSGMPETSDTSRLSAVITGCCFRVSYWYNKQQNSVCGHETYEGHIFLIPFPRKTSVSFPTMIRYRGKRERQKHVRTQIVTIFQIALAAELLEVLYDETSFINCSSVLS